MAAVYDEKSGLITLSTQHSTYQMQRDAMGYLLHLYYGRRAEGSASGILSYADRGFSGNPYDAGRDKTYSLDALPQEYSFIGTSDYRAPAFMLQNDNGAIGCDLRVEKVEIERGKYMLDGLPSSYAEDPDGVQTVTITLLDEASGVKVELVYGVFEYCDVITRAVRVRGGRHTCVIRKVSSLCLDFQFGDRDVVSFYGRHCMERNIQVTRIGHGKYSIGSRRGSSSHQYNPFVVIKEPGATEDYGKCFGIHLVYSGNFTFEALKDGYNGTRLLMGIPEEGFAWKLEPEDVFTAPEVILTYSNEGLSVMTNRVHDFFREHITRGYWKHRERPVLINNWEATYFDFDGDRLEKIAVEAEELGIDMLVLDDGWFGKRDTDFSGLGDWKVNTKKLKGTMHDVAEKIKSHHMMFGLWFEPEMVSEDSDLYREHPDWALKIPGRLPVRSRYQLVLDFSRKEVVDRIFHDMSEILDNADISYIKWDMNRHLTDVYSADLPADRQGEVYHRYVLGVYDLLRRLLGRYPKLLIEGCAGGGGRYDAGMLCYEPQIWCSDNTDAIDRCSIQYGTSFGYPTSTMGAHVSVVPNHQTGRVTPFKTRGIVAMAGTFGYELDPAQMTDEEKMLVKEQIKIFREDYPLTHEGDYFRLSSPYDESEMSSWMYVSKNKKKAVVSVVSLSAHGNGNVHYLRMKGLEEKAVYRIRETGKEYTGGMLMYSGLALPGLRFEYQALQLHLEA